MLWLTNVDLALTKSETVFHSLSASAIGFLPRANLWAGPSNNTSYRLKYALNSRETKAILMQRLLKVDGKVRTDTTYPVGFMDILTIEKTGENFRLVYDTKGRFTVHRISVQEAEYKLGKVKRVQVGRGGVPYCVIHDGRT